MKLKPGAALLFDIDGTLTDTDALHLSAFNHVLAPYGHVFDRERYARELMGFSMSDIAARFLPGIESPQQIAIMAEKEAVFRSLAGESLHPMPGLMALLDAAGRSGIPIAAVTNAPRVNAEMILGALGIRERFRALVIGDELAHGKPHPLPYLEGLRALGADAESSLAFEDSRSGVRAATAAGIATIGIATTLGHDDLIATGAVATVKDFGDRQISDWMARRLGI